MSKREKTERQGAIKILTASKLLFHRFVLFDLFSDFFNSKARREFRRRRAVAPKPARAVGLCAV